ncbi:putative Xre family transcriptional regulator [Selenomonas ruminantium subsp. lactilytica TAM6421]|uniref:Putative Xre family transcriptional regulator n=1 Tax=Selenomonas ruminantium subsp. lactilytica (strain NBRC 103574 / TAM6421) TaxID=927704 RepID=I0GMM1_SELRL|nr:helix-turn-helix transcriptional regulator [Selenomonas ruminantium]BAL82008.1 putative Xre family transcriptional regulator [Selenomonas ruminantium subsp. lactilytica TAM6421]
MNRIRELRKTQKLSQQDLATKIGVDRSTIAKWETGINNPRTNKLRQLADILSCPLEALLPESKTKHI